MTEWPAASDTSAWSRLADIAMQAEMLQIDREHSAQWLDTMEALVLRGLTRDEFTIARMAELKAWERRRKLAQTNLRYRYNAARRRPYLIRRAVREALLP